MSSLTACLKKAGNLIDDADKGLIRSIYADHLADGVKGKEAALRAVDDVTQMTLADRAEIAEQVEKAGGRIEAFPLTKRSESAIDDDATADSTATGRKGGEAAEGEPAPGGAAATSQGVPPAASADLDPGLRVRALARIIRQESATLDGEGNVIAGRPSRTAKAAGKSGRSLPLQRAGRAEPFDVAGFDGRVKAKKLDERDAREDNLARLTYEIYSPGTMKSAPAPLAEMELVQRFDGAWEVEYVESRQPREGIGTKLYDAVETDLGIRLSPSGVLSDKGYAFWQKRSPASVQWHVRTPTFADMYFSPRKITDEFDRIGRELSELSTGTGRAARIPAALREELRQGYFDERGALLKLYGKLPEEARARATLDQMFALRGGGNVVPFRKGVDTDAAIVTDRPAHARAFVGERLDLTEDNATSVDKIYADYQWWAGQVKAVPVGRGEFVALMREAGLEPVLVAGKERYFARLREIDEMFALRGFHGSPHEFDRFDLSKIGTGEGAQAFGHGLYFAENELTAQAYQRQLAGPERHQLNGKDLPDTANSFAVREYAQMKMDGNKAGLEAEKERLTVSIQTLQKQLGANDYGNAVLREVDELDLRTAQDQLAALNEIRQGDVTRALPGNTYEVEIDVEPEQLLDWDLPLAEQGEAVRNALATYNLPDDALGNEIYNALLNRTATDPLDMDPFGRARGASKDAASNALRETGIPGIRYLDQGSRATGEGTRNIVIFDDSLVKITAKNGKPVTADERQGVIDEMFALRGFYSPAIRAAENISQAKGTGEQFFKQITKVPGVRKDEIEWMGLEEFLADKKSITKDEVLAFMRAHRIELDEKVLGGNESHDAATLANRRFSEDFSDDSESFNEWLYDAAHTESIRNAFIAKHDEDIFEDASPVEIIREVEGNAALSQYRHEAWAAFGNDYIQDAVRDIGESAREEGAEATKFSPYKVPGGENYREFVIRLPGWKYDERHFGGPVLVHFRADDRTGVGGERIFFIHEIQATGHQKGRKKGYLTAEVIARNEVEVSRLQDELAVARKALSATKHSSDILAQDAATMRVTGLMDRLSDAERATSRLVTAAPFKGDLWLELALKRALLYAAENGYDAVSWARSDQIAKAVGADPKDLALQYDQKIGKFLDKYTRKWGGEVEEGRFIPLPTDQVRPATPSPELLARWDDLLAEIEPLQEMQIRPMARREPGFDDAMARLEELRDEQSRLHAEMVEEAQREGHVGAFEPNPILRITPEMRASVMEGQPLALRGGQPTPQILTPEFRNFFKESKVVDERGQPLVVYHATHADRDFTSFATGESDIGIHFGTSGQANDRIEYMTKWRGADNQRLMPAYLSIQNPIVLESDPGLWDPANLPFALKKTGIFTSEEIKSLEQYERYVYEDQADLNEVQADFSEEVKSLFEKHGFDGVKYWNTGEIPGMAAIMQRFDNAKTDAERSKIYAEKQQLEETGGNWSYIALYPTQIKSAIGNKGTFDPTDPSIINAMRRDQQQPEALGRTDPYNMTISLAMQAIEAEAAAKGVAPEQEAVRVFRHEAVEFFKAMGLFPEQEWNTLKTAARKNGWVETTGVRKAYEAVYKGGMSEAEISDLLIKEAIAEQYSEFHHGRKQFSGKIAAIFQRIKDFLARVVNFMRTGGFETWEDVFTRIDEGEFKARFEEAFPEMAGVGGEQISPMAIRGRRRDLPLSLPQPGATPGLAPSPAGSVIDIQNNLRHRLGLTVARGRLDQALKRQAAAGGGVLLGQFNKQTGVIRLKVLEDIGSQAHEIAHAFEDRYSGLERLKNTHAGELMGVARIVNQDTLTEGFAEWYRLYLTNPQAAQQHGPNFLKAFEDFLGSQDAKTLNDIREIRDQYQQWRNASSAGRLTAAIKSGVKRGTWEEIGREYSQGGLTSVGGMFWRYLEQVFKSRFDDTQPVRKIAMSMYYQAERTNQPLPDLSPWKNPWMQAEKIRLMDGRSYSDITKGISWENVDGRGSVSLREALLHAFGGAAYEQWSDAQRDAFDAYLIARRGRWLWRRFEMNPGQFRGRLANPPPNPQQGDWYFDTMRRQRRVFFGNRWETELLYEPDKHGRGDHEQTVTDLEAANPQFDAAAQMVHQFLRDLALKRYQAGLDSREEYEYKIGTPDYVPWFRDMSDEIFAGTPLAGRKVAPKFKIKGSYRDFISPTEGIIRQVFDTNFEIGVNKPKLLLAQMADAVKGAGRYAEIVPATRLRAEEVKIRDALENAAREEGLPPEDAKQMISAVAAMLGEDAVATLFRAEQAGDGRDAIVHYMDAGELKMLQIHDDGHGVARDLLGFFEHVRGTPMADSAMQMISSIVRIPQKGITSSVPFQWKNLIRDMTQATILVAGYFPFVSNARTVASNFARRTRGQEDWASTLARHGGIMGGLGRTDVQLVSQGRISKLRGDGVTMRPWKREFWKQTLNPWNEDFWRWNEWTEANIRQTIMRITFARALKDAQTRYPTMPAEQQTFVALEAGGHKSRDYTNYAKMGGAPSQIVANRTIMFLNPSLQGWAKSIRAALLAETTEGIFATSQVVRKKLLPLFNEDFQKRDLTQQEVDALKEAFRLWVMIVLISHAHLLLELGFNDPDDLKDKSEFERALYVTFTIDDEPYHIPRGFDLINIASNGLRAQYDSWFDEDPTAWARFRESLLYTLPPMSSPILDLYVGWKHNRHNFFESDIEPDYMKGRKPEERYTAYTSSLAKKAAESINKVSPIEVSPIMVEYSMNTIGSDWSRDILRAYDAFDPDKPALKWQEYPFIRSTRGLRGSRGSGDFWELMGRDGEFQQIAGSYKSEAVDAKAWDKGDIRKFFEERVKDDDAKAFAILNAHYDKDQRNLHPMVRARDMIQAVSATARAVEFNRVDVPVTSKISKRAEISRSARGAAKAILNEINRREYLNALIALRRPGYENREPMPVDPYLEELEAVSPDIHKVLMDKITKKGGTPRIYNYEKIREFWPEMRQRLIDRNKIEDIIENAGQVEYRDLNYAVGIARSTGLR